MIRRYRGNPNRPGRKESRNAMSGLNLLYRPATEAERIIDAFREGATVEELRVKYPDRDVDVILRARVWPRDGRGAKGAT